MGWWTVEKNGQALDIGDQPLDVLGSALKKVANTYRRDLKRRPTGEELAELLESSIRVFEEELFDDMDERELQSVSVQLRQRPERPKAKPGDYFAIPLPSGGYGYGRIMKIASRALLWMKLLNVRSDSLLSLGDVRNARVVIDIETRMRKIDSVEWPIIGSIPFSARDEAALANEPDWITGYTASDAEEIAEWKLAMKRGLPPNMSEPYAGYRGQ